MRTRRGSNPRGGGGHRGGGESEAAAMAEAERGRAETGLERVGARTGKGNYQERWSFRGGPALLLYPSLFVLFFFDGIAYDGTD
jgi:hypothetical protein